MGRNNLLLCNGRRRYAELDNHSLSVVSSSHALSIKHNNNLVYAHKTNNATRNNAMILLMSCGVCDRRWASKIIDFESTLHTHTQQIFCGRPQRRHRRHGRWVIGFMLACNFERVSSFGKSKTLLGRPATSARPNECAVSRTCHSPWDKEEKSAMSRERITRDCMYAIWNLILIGLRRHHILSAGGLKFSHGWFLLLYGSYQLHIHT